MVSVCLADIIKIFGIDMILDLTKEALLEGKLPDPYTSSSKLKFRDDPVVLSCASWRIGNAGGGLWTDLDEITNITEEDRLFGATVRKHFMDQLVMAKLRGQKLSDWRAKLGAFLVGNHDLTKAEVGMLYRLPYFYLEDQAVANVIKSTTPVAAFLRTRPYGQPFWKLCSVARIVQYRRKTDATQYWFRDDLDCPVMIAVSHSNSLYGVMDSLFDRGSISVAGHKAFWKPFYGLNDQYYMALTNFRLGQDV